MPSKPIPDDFPTLDLGDYVLRRIHADDAAAYDAYRADPEVTRYTSINAANEPATLAFPALDNGFKDKRSIRWAIAHKATNEMAGDCGFFEINQPHARAEVGYVIARAHWGRGVGTAALLAMVRWGYETLALHRIEAIIHPENVASLRVAEKAGFKREGTMRGRTLIRGAYSDMVLYSSLSDEWRPRSEFV
jgi:ribosomal-protein-alanine N-acetyltransferase